MKCASSFQINSDTVIRYNDTSDDIIACCSETPLQGSYFCKMHYKETPLHYPGIEL